MSKYHSYINSSAGIIRAYNATVPLALFLKDYFGKNKKFGSKDRKEIAALTHQFFRLGHLGNLLSIEEKILVADFVCRGSASQVVLNLMPDWCKTNMPDPIERLNFCGIEWSGTQHTPWLNHVSSGLNHNQYALSHLTQPDLFLRIRPGKRQKVILALDEAQILWRETDSDCIRLPNNTKLDEVIALNRDAVVQDLSSSRCGMVIKKTLPDFGGWIWDACAASGGKSILLSDLYGKKIKLIASDIRPSILQNLKRRFTEAGINPYHVFLADLTKPFHSYELPEVEMVLVDAPCTGSGTWARTPEQHYFFNPEKLDEFVQKQLSICTHVMSRLKPGGYIIYITCSVFEAENESVVERLVQSQPLSLVHMEYQVGMTIKADSMFIAILKKD